MAPWGGVLHTGPLLVEFCLSLPWNYGGWTLRPTAPLPQVSDMLRVLGPVPPISGPQKTKPDARELHSYYSEVWGPHLCIHPPGVWSAPLAGLCILPCNPTNMVNSHLVLRALQIGIPVSLTTTTPPACLLLQPLHL